MAGAEGAASLPQLPGAYERPLDAALATFAVAANCDGAAGAGAANVTGAGAGAAATTGVEGATSLPQLPSPQDWPLDEEL